MTKTQKTTESSKTDRKYNPLRQWVHPGTGEVRVYVNMGQLAKVWFVAADKEWKTLPEVKTRYRSIDEFPYYRGPMGEKPWDAIADEALDEVGIKGIFTWDQLLAAAEA